MRGGIETDEDSSYDVPVPTPPSVTSVPRPGSPTVRSPSPPLLSRSPKSPRTKIRSRSPRRAQYRQGIAGDLLSKSTKTKVEVIEEVDFPVESEQLTRPLSESPLPPIKAAENGAKLKDIDSANTARPIISNTIPRFYFPNGQCRADENVEKSLMEVAKVFREYPNDEVPLGEFHVVIKVCCIIVRDNNYAANILFNYSNEQHNYVWRKQRGKCIKSAQNIYYELLFHFSTVSNLL